MKTYLFEATNGVPANWGKFMVGIMEDEHEWGWRSGVDTESRRPLLASLGKSRRMVWVFDLQTGEGGLFLPDKFGGARSDLEKHRIHVCVLFEAFLEWLYKQNLNGIEELPKVIDFPEVLPEMFGYRRPGPDCCAG